MGGGLGSTVSPVMGGGAANSNLIMQTSYQKTTTPGQSQPMMNKMLDVPGKGGLGAQQSTIMTGSSLIHQSKSV